MDKLRVLLLTDSLGCPRKEINVLDTWTYRIIEKWADSECVIYTYCEHGLASTKIKIDYIREIQPHIIISQIGIVDACRRILSKNELYVISRIPVVGKTIHALFGKNHYNLTKVRNMHYSSITQFKRVVSDLAGIAEISFFFICIAKPGESMKSKVFHIEEDVEAYNNVVRRMKDIQFINPYNENDMKGILLEDGHHLTVSGHDLVYKAVNQVFEGIRG